MSVLLPLPYTTFDQVRDLGLEVRLYCHRCRREVTIDLDDDRLRGKSFAAGVRFTCTNVVQRWSAHPAEVCGGLASITVSPPKERLIKPGRAILHCELGCGRCVPSWGILQAQRDDPIWKPLFDHPRYGGLFCPACRAKLTTTWHGMDGIPFTDGHHRRGGALPPVNLG